MKRLVAPLSLLALLALMFTTLLPVREVQASRTLRPERCVSHTHRVPLDFRTAGVSAQYGWLRLERRVCFNNVQITSVPQTQVFMDLPDEVRVLNMLSRQQLQFTGSYEPWHGNSRGSLNSFYEASIRLTTPGVNVPSYTIPGTSWRIGGFRLPQYNGEIERPSIRIISLANGCYYAAPGGGPNAICPAGAYN